MYQNNFIVIQNSSFVSGQEIRITKEALDADKSKEDKLRKRFKLYCPKNLKLDLNMFVEDIISMLRKHGSTRSIIKNSSFPDTLYKYYKRLEVNINDR